MSGLKITVEGNFTHGISVKEDERLNAGSILLIEPARDGVSGIPTSLKNYASSEFYEFSGKTVDTLDTVDTLSNYPGGAVERTGKGGIHGIVPQTLPTGGERVRFAANLPQDVLDYCVANKNHSFYFAVVGVVTRNLELSGVGGITLAGLNSAPDGLSLSETTKTVNVFQRQGSKSVSGGVPVPETILGTQGAPIEEAPWLVDIARNQLSFDDPVRTTEARSELFTMGGRGIELFKEGMPSWVLYSIYLEDLTVSGRTYEQCNADGQTMFNRRFGADGRYENDSWTILD